MGHIKDTQPSQLFPIKLIIAYSRTKNIRGTLVKAKVNNTRHGQTTTGSNKLMQQIDPNIKSLILYSTSKIMSEICTLQNKGINYKLKSLGAFRTASVLT